LSTPPAERAPSVQAFRGALLHFLGDPDELGEGAHEYFDDGLLVLRHG
jgi:hypothetical protein